MLLTKVLVLSVLALFVVGMMTQVVWPLLTNRPLFPMFQRKRTALEAELVRLRGEKDQLALEAAVAEETEATQGLKRLGG